MKRYLVIALSALFLVPVYAKKEKKPQEVDSLGNKIKTGGNFGILPSIAYDADYGFQGGVAPSTPSIFIHSISRPLIPLNTMVYSVLTTTPSTSFRAIV